MLLPILAICMGASVGALARWGLALWFGIFIVLVVEMAQITPPVGFNLFVLQGMTGKDLLYIARVTLPMFFLMVAAILIIYFVPQLVTWLPQQMAP